VTLADRIARALAIAGYAMSIEQIARTMRCRTADVRIAMRMDERFRRVEDLSGSQPRYLYTLAGHQVGANEPPAGRGRAGRAMFAPGSQAGRILAVLADGSWHTTAEIHSRVGGCVLHSRISELRARGYTIEHKRTGPGAQGSRYRLLDAPAHVIGAGTSSGTVSPTEADRGSALLSPPSRSPEQQLALAADVDCGPATGSSAGTAASLAAFHATAGPARDAIAEA
jgi:hypothetical protein